jgi:hypothetical protein
VEVPWLRGAAYSQGPGAGTPSRPFRNVACKGPPEPPRRRTCAPGASRRIRRAKWALWYGQAWKTQVYLEDLCGGCHARRPETPRALVQLGKAAEELWGYLETNRDSLPHYGKRYRAGLPISTAFTESAVNEVVAKRMNKNQQMRWNRYTVQPFLTVRVHVLNGTLEEAFRAMHCSFRPPKCPPTAA